MTDNLKACPCDELKRALSGEHNELIEDLVIAHFAQLAEIERLRVYADYADIDRRMSEELIEKAAEIERLNKALDDILNLDVSCELGSIEIILDIARAAREREAANE